MGRVGLAICFDGSFPEVSRQLAWLGAEVIIQPTLTTTRDREMEVVMSRANAFANQVYVVNVNAAAPAGVGESVIVDPEGTIMQQAGGGEEVLFGVLDIDRVSSCGSSAPSASTGRGPAGRSVRARAVPDVRRCAGPAAGVGGRRAAARHGGRAGDRLRAGAARDVCDVVARYSTDGARHATDECASHGGSSHDSHTTRSVVHEASAQFAVRFAGVPHTSHAPMTSA